MAHELEKHASVASAMAQKLEAPLERKVPDRRMNDFLVSILGEVPVGEMSPKASKRGVVCFIAR